MTQFPTYSIYFDGQNLAAVDGVQIYDWDINGLPEREMNIFKLARRDKSIVTTAEYKQKEIVVRGHIWKNATHDAETALSLIKAQLQLPSRPLLVPQFDTTVEYICTLARIDSDWFGQIMRFALIFTASDPVGRDTTASVLLSGTAITTQQSTASVTVSGSYYAEPYFTVTLNSGTGLTSQSMTISNAATGQGLTITRTWTAGDIAIFDSRNRIITVNGAMVDYSGAFPIFKPGAGQVGYVDTFTTRNVTLAADYYKRYV